MSQFGHFFSSIKNGLFHNRAFIDIPHTRKIIPLLLLFLQEGLLSGLTFSTEVTASAMVSLPYQNFSQQLQTPEFLEQPLFQQLNEHPGFFQPKALHARKIRVFFKFMSNKQVISGIVQLSKPSRRIQLNRIALQRIYSPYFLLIISTQQGYVTGYRALQKGLGGELLCIIY